jgi:predicted CDP-diglyceride synthetase/phosphatidate cytidylyltransferase
MVLMLAAAILAAGIIALVARSRGGRFRGLPGWIGFWVVFGGILVLLSRGPRWASFPALAGFMFASLRALFYVAPLRPTDRYAILVVYASIPVALYPAWIGDRDLFLVVTPVSLFLAVPVLLSFSRDHSGLLDSMGRVLTGAVLFVFCLSHLGLMTHLPEGSIEFFGVLVIASELPTRLLWRARPSGGIGRPLIGTVLGAILGAGIGWLLGPPAGLGAVDGAIVGFVVSLAVAAGALVSEAVSRDLELGASASLVGRGSFLDRTVPIAYGAPVFYHVFGYLAGIS